jgi:hypothetical protein
MNLKNVITPVIVGAAIVLGVTWITKPKPVPPTPVVVNVPESNKPLGSVVGPDITSPFVSINGVTTYYNRKALIVGTTYNTGNTTTVNGTTTPCAIKSPGATSTLVFASYLDNSATATAKLLTIAKAANAFATTTRIGNRVRIGGNEQATVFASTTSNTTHPDPSVFVFEPNYYLVFGLEANAAVTVGQPSYSPSGTCTGNFVIN